jgi:DNA-binding LytR/AlgR family response regulator
MLKILIVDDEKKAREYMADLLHDVLSGVSVKKASGAREALELLQKNYYNILMTDAYMPGMDGLKLIEKVVSLNLSLFVVVVSAFDKFEYAQKSIAFGVNCYLLKPVYREQIEQMIEKYRQSRKFTLPSRYAVFRRGTCHYPVKIEDILAVEIQERRFLKVYKTDDTLDYVCEKLNEIFTGLPDCFIYISRQCFVNTLHIKTFNNIAREITMLQNGKKIVFRVSRDSCKKIKDKIKPV